MIMKPPSKSKAQTTGAGSRAAFTLFELLTVLAILAILLGLTIPVMGRARKTARIANNTTLLREVAVGSQQFRLDNADASPSYFTAKELASTENQTRGFSPMQSILLNLMGGIVPSDATSSNDVNDPILEVGPTAARTVKARASAMRAGESRARGSKAGYINLPPANLRTPFGGDDDEYPPVGPSRIDPSLQASGVYAAHARLPEFVDDFGSPVLAWVEDERPSPQQDFAQAGTDSFALMDAGSGNDSNAPKGRFYVDSNRLYLHGDFYQESALSPRLGRANAYTAEQRRSALSAVTGSVAFPLGSQWLNGAPFSANAFAMARASRSNIVLHSAGPDQVWLLNSDRGGVLAGIKPNQAGVVDQNKAVQFPRDTRNPDPMSDFDDIIVGVGN